MGLTIIMGNMFSGKTSELIRRLKRYRIIGKKIVVINSSKDTRSPEDMLKTHDGVEFQCLKVAHISHSTIKQDCCDPGIVAVDEAQFFTNLKDCVEMCLFLNRCVIIAGLDGDYKQRKFGEVIDCIPLASDVVKLSALCMDCKNGTPGPFTKRIVQSDKLELVGGNESYKAVCRRHLESMDVQNKNDSFLKTAFNKAVKSGMIK